MKGVRPWSAAAVVVVAAVVATVAEWSWIRPRYVTIRLDPVHRGVNEYRSTGPENSVVDPVLYSSPYSLS